MSEQQRECHLLKIKAKTAEQRFLKAMMALNQIEDLLEYRYKHYTVQQLRDEVMKHIDTLSTSLSEEK